MPCRGRGATGRRRSGGQSAVRTAAFDPHLCRSCRSSRRGRSRRMHALAGRHPPAQHGLGPAEGGAGRLAARGGGATQLVCQEGGHGRE